MKRLVAKVGEYQKDGQTKGEYVRIGVIMSNDNGEYALLDPAINLSGVLTKQNMFNAANGKRTGTSVMVSIFSDENQGQNQFQNQGQNQSLGQNQSTQQGAQPAPNFNDFDDDIPPF